jgi:hypothetical protein
MVVRLWHFIRVLCLEVPSRGSDRSTLPLAGLTFVLVPRLHATRTLCTPILVSVGIRTLSGCRPVYINGGWVSAYTAHTQPAGCPGSLLRGGPCWRPWPWYTACCCRCCCRGWRACWRPRGCWCTRGWPHAPWWPHVAHGRRPHVPWWRPHGWRHAIGCWHGRRALEPKP